MRGLPDIVPLFIVDIYELAGALRRRGEAIANAVGQTQARWQVLSAGWDGRKTVPQIARRLGVSRQNVQRIADVLVDESLAQFVGNPDHQASPYLVLTADGQATLAALSRAAQSQHQALAARLKGLDLEALQRGILAGRTAVDSLERRPPRIAARRIVKRRHAKDEVANRRSP
jgi:DNA-binding MarR family transcriptional regulator